MKYSIPIKNNFDFLRLFFASIVFLVHLQGLTLNSKLSFVEYLLSSEIAVRGFFVISGFLIIMSYENSKSTRNYLMKRVKRIYPAYFCVIILCALAGIFISRLSLTEYLSPDFVKYIFFNLLFLNFIEPTLPGIFVDNITRAVNGALWTIKIEVMFYILVPFLVFCFRKWNKFILITIIYVLSYIYYASFNTIFNETGRLIFGRLAVQLPGQLSYFLSGALLFYYFSFFAQKARLFLCLALFIYLANMTWGYLSILEPICLAVIVVYVAFFFFMDLSFFGKSGDLSYGIYLYHFPLIQYFIFSGISISNSLLSLGTLTLLLLLIAFISWHLIEKPFLKKMNSYYVKKEILINPKL